MSSSLTPDQALNKVLKTSRLNGWSVALFAGLCTGIATLLGDHIGFLVGLAVVASGIMEVRGNRLLHRRDSNGMRLLIRAQYLLIAVIHVYAITRILSFSGERLLETLTPAVRESLDAFALDPDELKQFVQTLTWVIYGAVILATWIYQGGLAFYYSRRKGLVEQALSAPPFVASGGETDKGRHG